MSTRRLLVETDDERYDGLVKVVAEYLSGSAEVAAVDVADDLIHESGFDKRPWEGDTAVDEAVDMLTSLTTKAWPLVKVFVDEPGLEGTEAEIAEKTEMAPATARSYRQHLGKQSYHRGQHRLNPISTKKADDGTTIWFMRPETTEVFTAALGKILNDLL